MILQSQSPLQYSFYAINVIGVQPISIRLGYQMRIDARNVMQIIVDYLFFIMSNECP
jgi:hypothetical protein